MGGKLYLSAAAHASDNPTKCPVPCSENTHCNAYMDIVERRMTELGATVKRAPADWVGDSGMKKKVREANNWGADLYYVAHTNAGGGRYSMTMCWPDTASRAKAQVIHKHRRCVGHHKVVTRRNLYEISATKMPCLYDELFFHDNAEDCEWFHGGGMELLAEETVKALCELLGILYPVVDGVVTPPTPKPKAGDKVTLDKEKLYLSSVGAAAVTRTGTFYLYDGKKVHGRYRVTNLKSRVGKKPLEKYVSGWVELPA
ncbi:MAG: N-acetylmuramoyl-L-alanine amidase [Clostridia bacterium]|nr:N-acetylmuramoyl-L-alanine amidase [Clostridia bacterium]